MVRGCVATCEIGFPIAVVVILTNRRIKYH